MSEVCARPARPPRLNAMCVGEVEYRLSFKTRAIETGKPTPTEAKHNMDAASSAKFHVEVCFARLALTAYLRSPWRRLSVLVS